MTKILFVDHPEADYLAALVYWGLRDELGPDNVVDWPFKPTFHGERYDGPVPYPCGVGVCDPFDWFPAVPGRRWSDEEAFARAAEFDLVVLASPRAYSIDALTRLIDRVGRSTLRRLVMMDGEDYTTNRWDLVERFAPSVYFKTSVSETPYEVYLGERDRVRDRVRLVPFPLATTVPEVAAVDKEYDVALFGGGNWCPGRRRGALPEPGARDRLVARLSFEFPNIVHRRTFHAEFISCLAKSRIAVSVGGWGMEPLRTYEILSCPGTMLAREIIDHVTPYPFVNGVHVLNFDGEDVDGLVRSIRYYLDHESERVEVARAGNEYLRAHYTPHARARQLLQESIG